MNESTEQPTNDEQVIDWAEIKRQAERQKRLQRQREVEATAKRRKRQSRQEVVVVGR